MYKKLEGLGSKPLAISVFLLLLVVSLWSGQASQAQTWQPRIHDAALPLRMVAIDKSKQQFYLYQKNTPFKLTHNYPCTTGQIIGDKQIQDDKRTPEGVYFVVYKIDSGLDFKEYGGIAYTLNYPNPVDKLRGKTGYGIWIHSKGDGIKPRITRGCIAIGLDEIATVGPLLTSGTPVLVGETLSPTVPTVDDGTAKQLRTRMEEWTQAWAGRSASFFDFYNEDSYTKATESFKAFRQNKERLFKRLKWINIINKEVHVLEGPGYWVTWSEQFYRAPNLSTEGIRRLYWQKDSDNVYRIVGMEWIPSNLGLQAAFKKGELVATNAEQKSDTTPTSKKDSPKDSQEGQPKAPPLSMPEAVAPKDASKDAPQSAKTLVAENAQKSTDKKDIQSEPITLTPLLRHQIQENIKTWRQAWQSQDSKTFFAFYDQEHYGKAAGQNYTNAFRDLKKIMTPYFKSPWVEMLVTEPTIVVRSYKQGEVIAATVKQWIFVPGKKPMEGEHTLFWQKTGTGPMEKWRIVASDWQKKSITLQVAYLEKISSTVDAMVEEWRTDWLSGNVGAYMRHYAPNARQGKRNKNSIAKQKEKLWAKAAPAKISLSGVRLQIVPQGISVDMVQKYTDSQNKGDTGTKTLLLIPTKDGWKIQNEEWVKISK